jgi:hypothetical protein
MAIELQTPIVSNSNRTSGRGRVRVPVRDLFLMLICNFSTGTGRV